jgi:tungstate transport system substrate-binding protein
MDRWITILLLLVLLITSGCTQLTSNEPDDRTLVLATTTSTYDSGLLDYLLPVFTERSGIVVNVISVGTGQAIELGRRGDADIILVHSPADEEKFISDGYGIERRCVMFNSFMVLGPAEDPASVKDAGVVDALENIAKTESTFVSRGDNSGTHKKELHLWNITHIEGRGNWYIETGTGMGQTLLTASEKKAYTLSDEATYLSMRNKLGLSVLITDDRLLLNPYSLIAVNPEKNPDINSEGAEKLTLWMVQDEA